MSVMRKLGIEEGSVYSFLIDSKGRRWIGPGWGLYMSQPNEKKYHKINEVGYCWIYDIMEDKDGLIWIATMGNGIWKCNPETGTYHNYYFNEKKSSNSVSSIMQDSKGIYGSLPTVAVYADIMKRRTTLPLSASKTGCRTM